MMLPMLKRILKILAPAFVVRGYHFALAHLAAITYGHPSRKMVVVGVLGTRGKTTTANFIWSVLASAGYWAGLTGTANIRIGNEERLNDLHMTMPGRFRLQQLLDEMWRAGCTHVVVETPSEGIEQFRHAGIAYDLLVLTKLYPEYSEAHGWNGARSIEANLIPFRNLSHAPEKKHQGRVVPKGAVIYLDDEYATQFLNATPVKKITYGTHPDADVRVAHVASREGGVSFRVGAKEYHVAFPGEFNATNAAAAIGAGHLLGIEEEKIQQGIAALTGIPGRMEELKEGQSFRVFVDYAHDAVSLEAALRAVHGMVPHGNIVVLFGGQGGGRDRKKLPVMGEVAAAHAAYVVLSNDDPFDDDPDEIIARIAEGAERKGKTYNENLFLIPDRRKGIRKAFSLAREGDAVLLAGKGADQLMYLADGKKMPWDDRAVAREELGLSGAHVSRPS